MDPLTDTLKSLLQLSRSAVKEIYESEDFLRSNMDLAGHIFLRITNSAVFKRQSKLFSKEVTDDLVRGSRKISEIVSTEFLGNLKCANEYEARILNAVKKSPLYEHEIVKALGKEELLGAVTASAIQSLTARGLIYRDDDFKYYPKKSHFARG